MTWMERILLVVLIAVPWGEGGADPSVLALIHTLVFAAAATLLWKSAKEGTIETLIPWPLLAWALFVIVGLAGMMRSEYLYGSLDTWWDQAIALILALALSCASPSRRFTRLAPMVVALSAAAQAVPAIVTRFTSGGAVSISFLNPNHLGAYLNIALFVALERGGWLGGAAPDRPEAGAPARATGAIGDGREWNGARLAWTAAAILCVAGVVAIASRGALLALAVTVLFLFAGGAARRPQGLRGARWLRAAPLVALVGGIGLLSIQMRFSAAEDPYRYDRPRIWMAALRSWADAPLLGLGPGMYEHRSARHNFPQEKAAFRYAKVPGSAHSQPIQTLSEEGIAGLGALAIVVAATGVALHLARGRPGAAGSAARALEPALVAAGTHSLFEMVFQPPAIPLTLLILSWPALRPGGTAQAAASFLLRWPARGPESRERRSMALSLAIGGVVLFIVAVAAPYGSYVASEYAASGSLPPVRIDLAFRAAESMNPTQPYIGYRRARSALARSRNLSPPLLANAMDSLEKTIRLEPGDPSAYALLGGLYARAATELPGAGPGALLAAERRLGQAIERAPFDVALLVERGGLRLSSGRKDLALEDAEAALLVEPNALAAHLLRIEACLASGRTDRARAALTEMSEAESRLGDHRPLNGYEAALMRVDARRLEEARRKIGG